MKYTQALDLMAKHEYPDRIASIACQKRELDLIVLGPRVALAFMLTSLDPKYQTWWELGMLRKREEADNPRNNNDDGMGDLAP